MADGLDVVTVRVEHEGAVVVRVVVRPQPRRAIVLAAGRERRVIERIDRRSIVRGDRHVQRTIDPALGADPEIRLAADAEAGGRVSAFGAVRADFP